jgi:hypothetical protein
MKHLPMVLVPEVKEFMDYHRVPLLLRLFLYNRVFSLKNNLTYGPIIGGQVSL